MAEYGAREDEVKSAWQTALSEDKKRFESNPQDLEKAQNFHNKFEKTISDYMSWRDNALNKGLDFLQEGSTPMDTLQSDWSRYYSDMAREASDRIKRDYQDDAAPALRRLTTNLSMEEQQFFNKIGEAPLAQFHSKMRSHKNAFTREKERLSNEWTRIRDNDKSIDDSAKSAISEIMSLYQRIVGDMANNVRVWESTIMGMISLVSKAPPGSPIPSVVKYPIQAVDDLLGQARNLREKTESLTQKLLEAQEKEKGLLIVFTNTRESVGKFLEGKTFENAEKDFREARDRALSKANECPTSRQRDDAKRFLEKAADKSRRELENFNQYYSNFVDQFKGIFFGPISDSTYNELLEPSDWSNYQGGLESFSIQEKIKQIYNDSDKAWKVSLDGFTDQQKREFEDLLKKEMDRLKGIIEVAEGSIIRRVGEVIRLRVAFLRDYLK